MKCTILLLYVGTEFVRLSARFGGLENAADNRIRAIATCNDINYFGGVKIAADNGHRR